MCSEQPTSSPRQSKINDISTVKFGQTPARDLDGCKLITEITKDVTKGASGLESICAYSSSEEEEAEADHALETCLSADMRSPEHSRKKARRDCPALKLPEGTRHA